jgi:uncharacterized protein DUF4383
MSTTGARSLGARGTHDGDDGRTPAQWYCLVAGLALLLLGILGFTADASFDTSTTGDGDATGNADGALQGDGFLGFEVNGWHNVVHLITGALLLAAFRRRGPAKTMAVAIGVFYGLVAIIGLIDSNDVLGLFPINPADNILHIALSALGIVTGLVSRGTDHIHRYHDRGRGERVEASRAVERQGRAGRDKPQDILSKLGGGIPGL